MNLVARSPIIRHWGHVTIQGGLLGCNKHTLAVGLVVYREAAKFFAGTVPLEGGQLIIGGGRCNGCAGDRPPTGGIDDHGTPKIEVTVADE